MREPRNGIGFAAAGRVLYQIALACAFGLNICQSLSHNIKLMVAWPNLVSLLLAGLWILLFNDLRVVLQNVGQPFRREHFFPEVVGFETRWVRRISRTVIETLVEWKKPGCFSFECGAHLDFAVIHCKMNHATPELKGKAS